ncbi:MAG: hypothetical protein FWD37_04695 [Methanomassiliicoccaceae archaeon]|nr:hypothetical protein [Methanomassiliicoccaceae archaeon]
MVDDTERMAQEMERRAREMLKVMEGTLGPYMGKEEDYDKIDPEKLAEMQRKMQETIAGIVSSAPKEAQGMMSELMNMTSEEAQEKIRAARQEMRGK